jgi:hypothetical protein
MVREFGQRWRQMDCSPLSLAKLSLWRGCKKKACEEDVPAKLPALVAALPEVPIVTILVVVMGFCTL